MMGKEKRTFSIKGLEVRESGEEAAPSKIVGYGAVFDSPADIAGCFTEIISPGAFKKALDSNSDVRALFNHNWDCVLGRVKSGTLMLEEDERGLRFEVTPPETTWVEDLKKSMRRGDIDQCSFGFIVTKDEWDYEAEPAVRTIKEVELYEISVVSLPAYEDTEAAVRSGDILKKAKEEREQSKKKQAIINKIQEVLQ
ncbi:HK97 family phage prohead protease [Bacillus safensis]|nr:HK97 family phage prohead protease [Bacillus safensis]MCK1973333.1 HK97 family phage prohead protease [Bacillus safensis]WHX74662.1 HK97 family phage prohead protease [Bacillus safensis]WHX82120.1 HK97 family phage prohead protease [Bacillus safensis]